VLLKSDPGYSLIATFAAVAYRVPLQRRLIAVNKKYRCAFTSPALENGQQKLASGQENHVVTID
jgi:hypothetical protein